MYEIKVYMIFNSKDNYTYIGSTKQKLKKRLSHHNTVANNMIKRKISDHIRNIGFKNFMICELESYNVKNKKQQFKFEQKWINIFRPKLNQQNSYSSKKTKKEIMSKWGYGYREKNKEKLKEKRSSYYKLNKEKEKLKHYNYVEKNRDSIREYDRQFRERNKERLNKKKREHYQLHKDEINYKRRNNKINI